MSVKIKIHITVINYNIACFSVRTMRDIGWMAAVPFLAWKDSPYVHMVQIGSRAHTASYPVRTWEPLSPGVKQPGCEADHSSPYSTEVNNGGAILLLLYVFMTSCLII
jgi:hypothetical protein